MKKSSVVLIGLVAVLAGSCSAPGGHSASVPSSGIKWTNSFAYSEPNLGGGKNLLYTLSTSGTAVYAATNAGLMVSTDGGVTWTQRTVGQLGINPYQTNVFQWSGPVPTPSLTGVLSTPTALWVTSNIGYSVSRDGGATWTYGLIDGVPQYVNSVVAKGNTVCLATNGGLLLSSDNGASWTLATTTNGLGSNIVYGAAISSAAVYAATQAGLSVLPSGSSAWTNYDQATGLADDDVESVVVAGASVFAETPYGISVQTTPGGPWTTPVSTDVGPMVVSPSGTEVYTGHGSFVLNGSTWSWNPQTSSGNPLPPMAAQTAGSYGTVLWSAGPGGLSSSADGGTTWKTLEFGLGSSWVNGITVGGSTVYASTLGGLSLSTDGGQSWKTYSSGSFSSVAVGGSTVWAATSDGVAVSSDGGMTWASCPTTGMGYVATQDLFGGPNSPDFITYPVNGILLTGNSVYAATGGGLSLSTNGGSSWTNVTTSGGLGNNWVSGLVLGGQTLYASTYGGLSTLAPGASVWTNQKFTVNGTLEVVSGVFVSGAAIYAATSGGLEISADGGKTWTNKTTSDGLGSNTVQCVTASGSTVLAGTNQGLSISKDGGKSWTLDNTSTGLAGTSVLGVTLSGTSVYVGTSGGVSVGQL